MTHFGWEEDRGRGRGAALRGAPVRGSRTRQGLTSGRFAARGFAVLIRGAQNRSRARSRSDGRTDRTKTDLAASLPTGPAIILVEPQLAQNVGSVARAMANFALSELRIVRGRAQADGEKARVFAAGAHHVIDAARHFDRVEDALADLTLVIATTAREREQAKPVDAPEAGAARMVAEAGAGGRAGLMFGRERTGLENDEIALAHRVVTFPVNPAYASLNLAQAVLLMGYEWFKAATGGAAPFEMPTRSPPATHEEIVALFAHLEGSSRRAASSARPPSAPRWSATSAT